MKKLYSVCVILSVLLFTTNIFAQVSFSPKTDFTTGSDPYSGSIGDFNGDGKPDLAVANLNSNMVSVLLNTTTQGATTPSFTAKTDFSAGINPYSISSGDFNGDGKPDLAVTNINSDTVSVLLNTTTQGATTPSFTAKTDFTTGINPHSVSSGDFNGDGKTDMAVANINSDTVSVLLNTTATNISGTTDACITWDLLSTNAVTSAVGNINGQPESIGVGSSSPFMSIFLPYSNGQRLWVGNTGWVAGPLDPMRYVEFNASPQPGNSLTVTNVSFNYGDFPLSTNFNILNFQAYYSTDNWVNSMVLNSTALVYLNTTMSLFAQPIVPGVLVPSGQTFSLRIYPYALQNGIAMTRTFAIHNNVVICGTTAPEVLDNGSICGVKYNDLNGNGVRNAGEPRLPNWTINLTGAATLITTTDEKGNYCFINLLAGTYTVSEVMQTGWQQTEPVSGTYTITLASGQNIGNRNFGNKLVSKPGSICGTKFNDLNGNGVWNAGEPRLPNWTINLTGASTLSVTTDGHGNYCFTDLPAGTYTVSEAIQTGWQQTAPPSPGTYTITLASGQNIVNRNFGNTCNKAWTALGSGMNQAVWPLAVMGGELYAGGQFTTAGGVSANHVAKWGCP